MRTSSLLVAVAIGIALDPRAAFAQRGRADPGAFTLADILSAPFPSDMVAAPHGARVAWIGNEEGRRNVWVAEAPAFRARRLTRYTADDGQELSGLTWTFDGRALLYVRGGAPGSNWSADVPVNPTSDPGGSDQAVWLVPVAGGAPRRLGDGAHPAASPAGDLVAFVLRDTMRVAPLRAAGPPRVLFRARGRSARPVWSPDGRSLAFVSMRGDHSFIGVYEVRRNALRWIAPTVDRDDFPRWSPDGSRLAFVRRPGSTSASGPATPAASGTTVPPWTIMVADAATGTTREAWRASATPDGALPGNAGEWVLQWAADDRLLFAAELGGWLGLYSVGAAGGEATRLTPQGCEVEDVALTGDRRLAYLTTNCGDLDRRHIQRVATSGGPVDSVTSGDAIEWSPRPLADSTLALLRSDARLPATPSIMPAGAGPEPMAGWPAPTALPAEQLVEPQQVIIRASDSTEVHLQLFLPPGGGTEGGRRPAVMFFHGGPQRQMLLGWHYRYYYHNSYAFNQYLASRGFVVVSVNYRSGIGYGRAFRQAPRTGRNGASEYADVLAAAAYLRSRTDVDTTRVGLWGGSYGGYLTALGLARNSDRFAAGVDLHGVHDWSRSGNPDARPMRIPDSVVARMRQASPVGSIERWRSPVLLIHGDDDRNVDFSQTVDLVQRLRRQGVSVEQLVFPDDVHDFLRHEHWLAAYRAAAEFFATRLGTGVAER
jgi:dipeptidyl aminopeptidase/acylaminoacyl peptidase